MNNIIWHVFIQYLTNEDALDDWLNALINNEDAIAPYDTYISEHFSWICSTNGWDYWNDLDHRWKIIHKQLQKRKPATNGGWEL